MRAVQNALAFTDYDLKKGAEKYRHAGLLVGSAALAANNWGIDGTFGARTYAALRQFQKDKAFTYGTDDGSYGPASRDALYFGEDHIDPSGSPFPGHKLTVKIGSGTNGMVALAVYAYNYG
ncbi:MAG: peptidoglycan-binding protein [Bifidobacteriaceae bacterium]|nr:peptidoglycan-binding protein [Bifidobacteriaceae bacterium]